MIEALTAEAHRRGTGSTCSARPASRAAASATSPRSAPIRSSPSAARSWSGPTPTAGAVKMIGQPIELDDTPARIRSAPPLLGEHTDDVLRETRYTDDEIRAFRERGAV